MRLVVATDEQKRARDWVTFDAWGMRLELEGYLERERRLRAHPWAAANMVTWLLCDEAGAPLASCESFKMDSLVQRPGGARERGHSLAIASVFTEPHLRGRGYASRMMALLVERLRQQPGAHSTVLYSDVGLGPYARAGYVERPGLDLTFPPAEGDPAQVVDALIPEASMAGALAEVPLPDDPVVIWPSASQLDWHLERERIYTAMLAMRRPTACGARAGRSTAFWAANVRNELFVLMMHAAAASEASALLLAARRMAARCRLERVRLWEFPVSFDWPLSDHGGSRVERSGSLSMICPLSPQVLPDGWRTIHRVLWV